LVEGYSEQVRYINRIDSLDGSEQIAYLGRLFDSTEEKIVAYKVDLVL